MGYNQSGNVLTCATRALDGAAKVTANVAQIRDMGETTIPFKTNEGIHRCMTLMSASVVKPLTPVQKVVQAGNVVALDQRTPHIRKRGEGAVIKLDVTSGVCTMDMRVGSMNMSSFQLAGTVSGQPPSASLQDRQQCAVVNKAKIAQGDEDEATELKAWRVRGQRTNASPHHQTKE